ncbi:MAG: Crp/Fnr family transcriptional regulator [Flavisolibacter sp.]
MMLRHSFKLFVHYLSSVEDLQKAIEKISPLDASRRPEFFNAWKEWQIPKDFFLLKENTVSDYIYFLEKGIVRIFYHKNEKEVTEWIALGGQFFLSITSFFQRSPSHLLIQSLVPSTVYGIHHDDLMRLANTYHDVERLLRKMVTASLILSQERMYSIQFETAQQRYDHLIRNHPQIIQQVPLTYIASFLGITLETLSRIRSRK